MWFDILKKEKTLEELVNSYINIYGKLYETNDAQTSNKVIQEMSKEVIRPMTDQRMYSELVEAVSKENFEQLSLEEFIKESTEIYVDSFNSDEKEYDYERDRVLRRKVPIHKEEEFYTKLFEDPKFLEARENFNNYHARIREEKIRRRAAEAKRNQERMMALQRARTTGKYKGRKGQRKQSKQPRKKKGRSERQASAQRDRDKQAQKDKEYREKERRNLRNIRRGL